MPLILAVVFLCHSCKDDNTGQGDCYDDTSIQQLQFLGSHNSFRTKTYEPIFDFVINFASVLPEDLNPEGWDYTHVLMSEQFSQHNVRAIELDIFNDPDGGLFYNRQGNEVVGESAESGIPELLEPGFKVLHIPDIDYNTNYYSFVSALTAVRDWSQSNPNHEPIFIQVETEETSVADFLPDAGYAETIPFTEESMVEVEQEIKSVFGNDLNGVFTPSMLQGNYPSVNEAARAGNWPTLREARGHVFFIMSESLGLYLNGSEDLSGKIIFPMAGPDDSYAAFVKMDNPISNQEEIKDLVSQGFMVRTRSDVDTQEARSGDTTRRDAAFSSGAHIISTDYYIPDPRHTDSEEWTDFQVQLQSGRAVQGNPVSYTGMECE